MLEKEKKVGEYVLVEKLGSGGFGEVWKAEKRTRLSISYFAVKFFRPNNEEKIDLGSVRKEVNTWQSLSGLPNVISVIEANIFEDYVYIVSDFAEGGSLDKWLKDHDGQAGSVEEAVDLTCQILQGLEGMHRAGFVHRDLKPANILIKKGVLYLADFGLSREMKSHSQTTSTAGTIGYMPPEAFAKKPRVSIHTDIWATGVILQKLLTGQLPFPQDEIPSLITSILLHEPEPMPDTVPPALRGVVNRALQKKREDRFQWAREMRDALRAALIPGEIQKIQQNLQTEVRPHQILAETAVLEDPATEFRREVISPAEANENKEHNSQLTNEKWMESQLTVQANLTPTQLNRIKREVVNIQPPKSDKAPPPVGKPKAGFGVKLGFGFGSLMLVGVLALAGYNWSLFSSNNSAQLSANKPVKNTVSATPSNLPKNLKNSIGMEFVKLPPGIFMMGSPSDEWQRDANESPLHQVVIDYEMYLGKFEVTQEEYEKVMGINPSTFKNCPRCPVENVNWDEAKEFIAKLNAQNDEYRYRLPSEAEWEYAARAGAKTVFGIGDGHNLSSDQANFDGRHPFREAPKGRYLERTVPVGSYQPNAWGLHDMNGNVWEWCEDIYQNNYEGLSTDGSPNLTLGEPDQRMMRGGAWINIGNGVRSAVRLAVSPSRRLHYHGFRVALTVK